MRRVFARCSGRGRAASRLCRRAPSAQWFKYPTAGVPRTATGAVNVNAPAPRTADGKPDLSGIWLAANHLPCPPLLRDGDDCLEKTPLSAWAYRIDAGVKEPLPFQPWAAAAAQAALRRQLRRRSARQVPAVEPAARLHAAALSEDHPAAHVPRAAHRVQRQLPADLHRRPAAAGGSAAVVARLLDRPVGRRHAGGREQRVPRRVVARHVGNAADRRRDDHRAPHAAELRHPEDRLHGGRSRRPTRARGRSQLEQAIVVDTDLIEEICLEGLKPHAPAVRK